MKLGLAGGLVGAVLTCMAATPLIAAECVKVVGADSGGGKITMDPAFLATDDDAYHMFAVYNRFVDLDETMNVVPEIAESWSPSPDGKSWTFKIQQGVKFHDGSDLDAADVVYTF